jgi:hypothetical protein
MTQVFVVKPPVETVKCSRKMENVKKRNLSRIDVLLLLIGNTLSVKLIV